MNNKRKIQLIKKGLLFWLSRKIDYPLIPPDCIQINFTFRCNLRCKMCSMHDLSRSFKSRNKPYELNIAVMENLIREAGEMGIKSLILIGGEPFLEPKILELAAFGKECGMQGITIVTNGTLFTRELIQKIFDYKLDNLNFSVSIDAASEGSFAKIRGENVLQKIIGNIDLINAMKTKENKPYPNICSVCTIMDQNIEELMDIVTLCRKIKISRIILQPVVANNTDQRIRDSSRPTFIPEERYKILDSAIDSLVKFKRSSEANFDFIANSAGNLELMKSYFRGKMRGWKMPCYAGYNRLQVVQEGKVYFCVEQENSEATFGDVSKDSLKSLWFSKKARDYRGLIRKCRFPCLQWCSYRDEFIEFAGIFEKERLFKKRR
ncbi:MAG: radical SAM protein [Candidatus Omnitrophica bacterium]|nr:radical SAM protein [Candidatus Omnitrophota bacterium]